MTTTPTAVAPPTAPRCAVLLGWDPVTGMAATPVAAVAAAAAELAVSWIPFSDGRDETWRAVLATTASTDWATQLEWWAAEQPTTWALQLVHPPTDSSDLREVAEQLVDEVLAHGGPR